jgi:hypothetical protein
MPLAARSPVRRRNPESVTEEGMGAQTRMHTMVQAPEDGVAVSSREVATRPDASRPARAGGWARRLRCGRPW